MLNNLNADAQESAAAETCRSNYSDNKLHLLKQLAPTAHDDFDWSVDKRNVTSYTKEEKEKYDKVYENTFVQLNDGELIKGLVVGAYKNRCCIEHRF